MARKPTLDELRRLATKGDVTFQIDRWYNSQELRASQFRPYSRQELLTIQRVGYIGTAKRWLQSMRPSAMYRPIMTGERYPLYQPVGTRDGRIQIGSYSLGQRLTAARRWAKKAGVPLEQIAEDFCLTRMLLVTPEPEPEPIPRGC